MMSLELKVFITYDNKRIIKSLNEIVKCPICGCGLFEEEVKDEFSCVFCSNIL